MSEPPLDDTAEHQKASPVHGMAPTSIVGSTGYKAPRNGLKEMRIRLTRKLSQLLNGVDLSGQSVGDVIDLPLHDAELLLAEGWALPAADNNFKPSKAGDAARHTPKRR